MQSSKPFTYNHQYTFAELDLFEIFYFRGYKYVKKGDDKARNLDQHAQELTTFKAGDTIAVCDPRWLEPTY